MGQAATPIYVRSGLASYDATRWTGGTPAVEHARRAFGIATMVQTGGSGIAGVMEADVPPTGNAVAVFRIGGGTARIDRRIAGSPARVDYRPGEASLLAPGTDSWWAVDETTSKGWFHIHFDGELLAEAEAAHGLRLATVPAIDDRQIGGLAMLLFDLASGAEEPEPMLWQSLGQVLLWRLLLLGSGAQPEARGGLAGWQVKRTTEYLADNLERRVTLDELAGIARLSPFHFARAFARTVGMPPHRYQQKLRMERARDLLANSDLRIIEIALAVGYESPQALARAFAQHHGMAPSRWRRLNGGG